MTSAAAVKALDLADGADVHRATVESALAQIEVSLAKDRALRLLGYRDRSATELNRRLLDSGYPKAVVASVIHRLTELGLIDDERFARAWVRARTSSGFGVRRISRELADKGIDRDIAAVALAEESPGDERLSAAVRALRGVAATDRKQRDRLVRRLVAKGHDLSIAIKAVDSASNVEDLDPG